MNNYYKYSRTYHVPWSEGTQSDDRILEDISHFENQQIVVTLKMDGENTSMYSDHIHARSLDSKHHESRNWVKQLHSTICSSIPDNWRIVGENMYAKHSIFYKNLKSYFYVFAIYDDKNTCLSWDETKTYCELLGLVHVPVLYEGIWDLNRVKSCWTEYDSDGNEQEGYVIRVKDSFSYENQDEGVYSKYTAKYVRKNHVQTSQHWMNEKIILNELE